MRIDIDSCEEILITITRNKTRSLLTAFGVFWGIFMLVALIGGGQGMQQAMSSQFEGFATNSAFLVSQKTGEAYKGFRKGRWWNLELSDIERLRNGVEQEKIQAILDGVGPSGKIYALKNVNDRIRLKYGKGYGMSINSELGRGTAVEVRIARWMEEERHEGIDR